jgi:hypothetical protein
MPQCQFLFSAIFVFRKVSQEIFLELDEIKVEVPIFSDTRRSPKQRRRGARGWPHPPPMARPRPSPHWGMVWAPGPLPDIAPPHIYSPRWENPKYPINFLETYREPSVVVDPRLGGSRSSSRQPAGEGNHHRRPSSSPCLPPEWCVSSLPWTMGS